MTYLTKVEIPDRQIFGDIGSWRGEGTQDRKDTASVTVVALYVLTVALLAIPTLVLPVLTAVAAFAS